MIFILFGWSFFHFQFYFLFFIYILFLMFRWLLICALCDYANSFIIAFFSRRHTNTPSWERWKMKTKENRIFKIVAHKWDRKKNEEGKKWKRKFAHGSVYIIATTMFCVLITLRDFLFNFVVVVVTLSLESHENVCFIVIYIW